MPKSITDVTSAKTLPRSAAASAASRVLRSDPAVRANLDHACQPGDPTEEHQADEESEPWAGQGDKRGRLPRRHRRQEPRVRGLQERAEHEEEQRDDHACVAAACREQLARRAAAADLHAYAEHQRPHKHVEARRRDRSTHGLPEDRPCRQQWAEHRAGDRQHEHLGSQSGAALISDEDPPGGREPERRVIEHDAGDG
jgi:hypothetical protein